MEGWIIKLYSKINCGLVPLKGTALYVIKTWDVIDRVQGDYFYDLSLFVAAQWR